jgi:hypothetical protein
MLHLKAHGRSSFDTKLVSILEAPLKLALLSIPIEPKGETKVLGRRED